MTEELEYQGDLALPAQQLEFWDSVSIRPSIDIMKLVRLGGYPAAHPDPSPEQVNSDFFGVVIISYPILPDLMTCTVGRSGFKHISSSPPANAVDDVRSPCIALHG